MNSPFPEQSIHYKSSIKRAFVEGMRTVFASHPDQGYARTKVSLDYPMDENAYPSIVVRFFESEIFNMGIAHQEAQRYFTGTGFQHKKFKHYLYHGDIEFSIYTLSSLDRDNIADTVVQTITMGDMTEYTNGILERIYNPTVVEAKYNWININTDVLQPMGEQETPAPWNADTQLIYQTGYRVKIGGEFYSPDPPSKTFGIVEEVDTFPYTAQDPVPQGAADPAPWVDQS